MISKDIVAASVAVGYLSIAYFFSLIFALPVWLTACLFALFAVILYQKYRNADFGNHQEANAQPVVYLLLLFGLYILISSSIQQAEKHGGWDAWWFWNYHAKFLAHPEVWKEAYSIQSTELLKPRVSHADYPLMLPATIGFFWRLLATDSQLFPFIVGFAFAALIPLLIFFETYRKNLLIAGILIFAFVSNKTFVRQGVNQMADILVAFFYLSAFVTWERYRETGKPNWLFLTGAMLGSCLWLKNEGVLLSAAFIVFHGRTLVSKGNLNPFLLGLAPFLIALTIFKIFFSIPGDLAISTGNDLIEKMSNEDRWSVILNGIKDSINADYAGVKIYSVLCLIFCLIKKNIPIKNLGSILLCILGFMVAYLISPHNIEWHVNTSIDRVLLQLLPAYVYILTIPLTTDTPLNSHLNSNCVNS